MKRLIPLFLMIAGCATNGGGTVDDEQSIRDWFQDYIKASRSGDLDTVLSLLSDDGVFLAPGDVRMDKKTFAAAVTFDPNNTDFTFEGKSEIEEIRVEGDLAYILSRTKVTITPGGTYAGYSLSVLEKRGGTWRIIRHANTITPVKE